MDFEPDADQQQLLAPCERLVRERCGFDARRRHLRAAPDDPPPLWAALVELGLPALLVPAAAGGLGRPAVDAALAAQALGAGLLLEPYADAAVATPVLLAAVPDADACAPCLDAVVAGAIALPVAAQAQPDGTLVATAAHAAQADAFLLLHDDALLALTAPHAARRIWRQFDGLPAAEVVLDPAAGRVLAHGDAARRAWDAGQRAGRLARIAEGIGLARTVLDTTADYLRTRRQFGQPLGRFQALAHRMADLLVMHELAHSLLLAAALRFDAADGPVLLDQAELLAHRALRAIGQQAIQLHGGIGMTDDVPVSHHAKRLLGIEIELGPVEPLLRRLVAAG